MKLQLLLLGVIISSCSLSEKERNETAIITCNILSETRNFQSSERIKEINNNVEFFLPMLSPGYSWVP